MWHPIPRNPISRYWHDNGKHEWQWGLRNVLLFASSNFLKKRLPLSFSVSNYGPSLRLHVGLDIAWLKSYNWTPLASKVGSSDPGKKLRRSTTDDRRERRAAQTLRHKAYPIPWDDYDRRLRWWCSSQGDLLVEHHGFPLEAIFEVSRCLQR